MIHITLKGQVYRLSFPLKPVLFCFIMALGKPFVENPWIFDISAMCSVKVFDLDNLAVRLPPGREVMLVTVYEALTLMVAFSALVVCIINTKNK